VRSQLTGGRYPTRRFILLAVGAVALDMPFLISGTGGVPLLLVGFPMLWLDWRYPWAGLGLDFAFASLAEVHDGESVRLRAFQLVGKRGSIEIVATDERMVWGLRALQDGHGSLGLTGRTGIEFHEISRIEKTGHEIRIWTRTHAYSIRFVPLHGRGGYAAGDWFSYLEEVCLEADLSIREPELVRNSRLLRPAIVAAIVLIAGVPYTVFVWAAFHDAGWL